MRNNVFNSVYDTIVTTFQRVRCQKNTRNQTHTIKPSEYAIKYLLLKLRFNNLIIFYQSN